ncbi:MAG: YceD family protein [Oscillospiraceae bacterium]
MKLNIRQVFNIVGEKKTLDLKVPLQELEDVRGFTFDTPVSVKGEVYNRAGIVTLDFNVTCILDLLCDRCLTPFKREFSYDFKHTIVKSVSNNQDDDDYILADGDFVDITEIAISDLLLQLPTKILCKDDCKGLCQNCGANLNDGDCGCLN